jgi:hypothetical protein
MSCFARSETANLVPLRLERSESAASLEYFLAAANLSTILHNYKPKTHSMKSPQTYLRLTQKFPTESHSTKFKMLNSITILRQP